MTITSRNDLLATEFATFIATRDDNESIYSALKDVFTIFPHFGNTTCRHVGEILKKYNRINGVSEGPDKMTLTTSTAKTLDAEIKGWTDLKFFSSPEFAKIKTLIKGEPICPEYRDIFRAFELTPLSETRVLILGQDPYPNPRYACGLAFSIPRSETMKPPSLVNIFTELSRDLRVPVPAHGDLTKWAKQGVLLLNASLTCKQWTPRSHDDLPWSCLIEEVFRVLSEKKKIVFVLWGQRAQEYSRFVKSAAAVILAPHPSPYSASTGFFGSRPFSTINRYLVECGGKPIDWDLSTD